MTEESYLHFLFRQCLDAEYIHAGDAADYCISRHGSILYIFFQCSNGIRDWSNNLDFPARAYSNGDNCWFVYRGFLRVWKSVRKEIEDKVRIELQRGGVTHIVCVGYSHGAALAGLATEDLQFLFGNSVLVSGYGFGCPRFLWGIVGRCVKARFFRFTVVRNIPDLVTHLPPAIFGYSHVSKPLRVGKIGKYTPVGAHYPEAYLAEL